MSSRFVIRYHYAVEEHDIPRLSREWQARIRHTIETKLTVYPDIFGKPLRRSLAGCRKLRVGDYRVAFTITASEVKVWAIAHRRDVYAIVGKRLPVDF
ncbi:MAG: type II toxin-antitoxin system RelE/ParE family toxin [Patescibacteria group bacterium]